MGVDEEDVRVAEHWTPRDVVMNIPVDCARRIVFIGRFIGAMKGLEGKVQLFLNAGDHVHIYACFTDVLKEIGLEGKYKYINSSEGVTTFRGNLLAGNKPDTTFLQ